ncbi:hypothetical protein HK26_04270 [Acetobacter okinawensis]|uniref:Uncharacterized protein n=1 Tax=Acetobacter okinawensis TaxID=1076594 RepID=A0A252BY13_9PROT|nr:hypothetical protein HK26_04270 [Acetobacter okinawensis]
MVLRIFSITAMPCKNGTYLDKCIYKMIYIYIKLILSYLKEIHSHINFLFFLFLFYLYLILLFFVRFLITATPDGRKFFPYNAHTDQYLTNFLTIAGQAQIL